MISLPVSLIKASVATAEDAEVHMFVKLANVSLTWAILLLWM